jgi:hypothetical protein
MPVNVAVYRWSAIEPRGGLPAVGSHASLILATFKQRVGTDRPRTGRALPRRTSSGSAKRNPTMRSHAVA